MSAAIPTPAFAADAFSADALLAEVLDWVRVESPTFEPALVGRLQAVAARRLAGLGFSIEEVPGRDGLAGVLVARRPGRRPGRGLLVVGHLDTVHPAGTLAGGLPVRHEGDRCYGPGIYDMKAGIVMMIAALAAAIEAGTLAVPVTVLLNADEEVGSPHSRALIEAEARAHAHVLIPEPAFGPAGEVTTGRHSFQRFTVRTRGRPAHAGWTNPEGRSAIRVMAQLVEEIEARSDFAAGRTYAVGVIEGGRWVNCVPVACTAQVLGVARDPAGVEEVGRVMESVRGERSGVAVEVERGPVRPLWTAGPGTLALHDRARRLARDLGFDLPHAQHGGGSDGNFTGALGVPTLDGLGATGHGAHTLEEHILVSSLVPRTAMLARLVSELG